MAGKTTPLSTDETQLEDPEEFFALQAQLDAVAEEKRKALEDPGPSWREWWWFSASKWYLGLLLFVLDIWLIAAGIETGLLGLALLLTLGVLYVEFLLWRFLYFVPREPDDPNHPFRPTWSRPAQFGRWTPEGEAVRHGGRVIIEGTPDPNHYL
jgi:hypothetical protein